MRCETSAELKTTQMVFARVTTATEGVINTIMLPTKELP
jgi:hypothetical protein